MDDILNLHFWQSNLQATFSDFKGVLFGYVPNIIAALMVILLGLMLSRLLSFLGKKIGRFLFKVSFTFDRKTSLSSTKDKFSNALGLFLYWVTFVYFSVFALRVLDIPGVSLWIMQLVNFLPKMLSLLSIAVIGFLLGTFAKVFISEHSSKVSKGTLLLAQVTKYSIFTLFTLWGLAYLGIDTTIIFNFIAIILSLVLGAAALGFGLGANGHVANLIAANRARQVLQVGESIQIKEHSGTIIEISQTGILLEQNQGVVYIPAKIINDEMIVKNK